MSGRPSTPAAPNAQLVQREADLDLLREVLHRGDELTDREREAFGDMRDKLEASPRRYTGAPRELEPKQRSWVDGVAERVGVSFARDNSSVPRGAEVELEIDKMPRPLAPPGRRTA